MTTVREIIPSALAGERLDRVVSLVTGASRADATLLVAAGEVEVNGAVVTTKARRLVEGDEVCVTWEPVVGTAPLMPDPSVAFTVVHADDDVVVVNKPAGLVVHPGAGNDAGTLVHGLIARYPEIVHAGDPARPGIVHRLDKDTSGLMMAARNERAYEALVEQLSDRLVDRRYVALVWGHFDVDAGMIEAPIGRSMREPTRMTISERGREAITRYTVQAAFNDPVPVSLVDCKLETGRTHQIRVHMQAIGHAVVGDNRYNGARQSLPAPRMFLHAAHLGFEHPVTGDVLSFDAPLPADLQAVLDTLS